jgi:hypothetical protein
MVRAHCESASSGGVEVNIVQSIGTTAPRAGAVSEASVRRMSIGRLLCLANLSRQEVGFANAQAAGTAKEAQVP